MHIFCLNVAVYLPGTWHRRFSGAHRDDTISAVSLGFVLSSFWLMRRHHVSFLLHSLVNTVKERGGETHRGRQPDLQKTKREMDGGGKDTVRSRCGSLMCVSGFTRDFTWCFLTSVCVFVCVQGAIDCILTRREQ